MDKQAPDVLHRSVMSSIAAELLATTTAPVVVAPLDGSETASADEDELANLVEEHPASPVAKQQHTCAGTGGIVLQCLKKHGQCLDLEIAQETGISLAIVREELANLEAAEEIITCNLTRFEKGKRTEALECRVSGYSPPSARGSKY